MNQGFMENALAYSSGERRPSLFASAVLKVLLTAGLALASFWSTKPSWLVSSAEKLFASTGAESAA